MSYPKGMALHIEDPEVERLARALSLRDGLPVETVVLQSLQSRQTQTVAERQARIRKVLQEEIWPTIPDELKGKPIGKEEEEELLGYGPGEY